LQQNKQKYNRNLQGLASGGDFGFGIRGLGVWGRRWQRDLTDTHRNAVKNGPFPWRVKKWVAETKTKV